MRKIDIERIERAVISMARQISAALSRVDEKWPSACASIVDGPLSVEWDIGKSEVSYAFSVKVRITDEEANIRASDRRIYHEYVLTVSRVDNRRVIFDESVRLLEGLVKSIRTTYWDERNQCDRERWPADMLQSAP